MAAPVSDLPAPDSPTTPRISPGAMSNEMSSSATSVPRRVGELDAQMANFEQRRQASSRQLGAWRRAAADRLLVVDPDA